MGSTMAQPILTLTTDFGASDHYVGAMKGVILGICPRAQIVDISHQVTPYAIAEGAYVIAQAYECFPKKTVHVVVVDPGVGTARRPILVEAAGQFFIGPDNGVLSMVYSRQKHKVRLIANQVYFLQPVSSTFHGRDIFAPVAAHLAAGVAPARMGKLIQDYLQPDFLNPLRTGERMWTGRILKIDRFGNIVTNFHIRDFQLAKKLGENRPQAGAADDTVCPTSALPMHQPVDLESTAPVAVAQAVSPASFSVTIGRRKISTLVQNYAEGRPGEPILIVGSAGYLEVSVNQGSAAEQIGCKTSATITLTMAL
jgi:S-adenosylmethionine hydrolase